MVHRSIDGPFCTSVVPIKDPTSGNSNLRKRPMDRTMAPEQASTYAAKGKSKFVVHSQRIIIDEDAEDTDSNGTTASSSKATSVGDILVPQNTDPSPVAEEPNRWCVRGQYQIYRDARMLSEIEKMARLVTEERRVLTGSLHTAPDIHPLFQRHKCEWIARGPGSFSEEIVREFYASYATTLRGSIDRRAKTASQPPLTATLVRGFSVEISETIFRRFLYGPSHTLPINTAKFDYRMDIIWSGLCRDAGVPVWHYDRLLQETKTLDIGLIQDEVNVVAPRRELQVEVPPLGANLVANVEQMQGEESTSPATTEDAPASPSSAASQGPSSSKATPSSGYVVMPLARVQKLETQMATLLQHVRPWMQRSIE
uniref:Integrase core domain containing protein n=1 Tax=Solanum tuberosum TaxID=4113 RepID=M1DR12_SOLTU